MIKFILNNQTITTKKAAGSSLLDFIRRDVRLSGTKVGCREGDCGACTVLEGSIVGGVLTYKSIVSCLCPLQNAHGKHIVTIEGLNLKEMTPVQKAMADNSATQCGFCTPGFVVALSGHLLSDSEKGSKAAVSGNICRCTGYKSIEKAAEEVDFLKKSLLNGKQIKQMIEKGWLPVYFLSIEDRLKDIVGLKTDLYGVFVAGGTDLMVQQAHKIRKKNVAKSFALIPGNIELVGDKIQIGAAASISDFFDNELIAKYFPSLPAFSKLIASGQIRNMGTLAGNIVNASPIGDLSVILLALNAELLIGDSVGQTKQIALKNFFIDYKKTILKEGKIIKFIIIPIPKKGIKFNFEKVSKRTYLDIASVNTAISIRMTANKIDEVFLSVGGVSPIPKFMLLTNGFLLGKEISINTLNTAINIFNEEISPISDIRGSREYKQLLLRQLFLSHFLKLFPEIISEQEIHNIMATKIISYEKH